MRIILTLLVGIVSSFYLSEVISRFIRKYLGYPGLKVFHHGSLGLLLSLLGFIGAVFGSNFFPGPNITLISTLLIGTGLGMIFHHLLAQGFVVAEKLERNFASRHENGIERMIEMMPGILTWLALTSPLWLSLTLPFAAAYLLVVANIYWLLTSVKIAVLIFFGYHKMEQVKKINWIERLKQDFPDEWENYYHIYVIPTYKESLEVLAPVFDAISNSNYPKDKIFIGVGFEAWDAPDKIKDCQEYLNKLTKKIGGIFTTIHDLQEGEIKGPATNRNCIVLNMVKEFKKRGIKESQVIVTTLDADFVVHPEFLGGVLHKYLSTPEKERDKRSFTGTFLYYNNYWQAPALTRLIATGTAFWQLSEMVGSDKYMNFSSLSINLKPLLEIGLWIPNKVNDDSGFFWKAYYHFRGDYKVIPHFLPISADAVLDVNLVKTLQNQYLQLKRWAYGVEHMPFIVTSYFKDKQMNFWDKTDKLLFVIWGNFRWGTLALLITFGGLLIPLVNPHYSESVVAYNLPVISSYILTAAFFSMFATVYVQEKTAPKRPQSWSWLQRFWSYIQWVLVPLTLVTISTLPAIDAQTSLMFGRYLEFRTTIKARK